MIKPMKEDLVKELAKHGVSQRSIAKQLGIARNTVGNILTSSGIRPVCDKESQSSKVGKQTDYRSVRCFYYGLQS